MRREKSPRSVTFATACYEGDYQKVLDPDYLIKKIDYHSFPFSEKKLIINNVENESFVLQIAEKRRKEGFFTEIILAKEVQKEALSFFGLSRLDFKSLVEEVSDDWIFYNALAPLAAIYTTQTPYLLYTTGDVFLSQKTAWIDEALDLLEKKEKYKVANLTWNDRFDEARKEAYRRKRNFWVAKEGFSDQLFLVKTKDFRAPIFGEIREDASHFPRGDVFEKRVFSYMKNRKWRRLTYQKGSYIHV